MPAWRGEEVEEEEREGAARIVPGRRGEGARKRGGENTERYNPRSVISSSPRRPPPMALRHQDSAIYFILVVFLHPKPKSSIGRKPRVRSFEFECFFNAPAEIPAASNLSRT
jgi:hypothetical protein